ncbi:MAG TPA: hypothetical protein VH089_20350 [Streptosporangiaceae bacterium]|nr:hypothetical protein [Streptosporangiaceae bacterium]
MPNFRWRDGWPVRAVAIATTAYSVAITIRPEILARPCRLTNDDGSVPAALAVAPPGYPMNVLTAARVIADGADAAWFGRVVPPGQRAKVAGVATGWAALELVAAVAGHRPAPRTRPAPGVRAHDLE